MMCRSRHLTDSQIDHCHRNTSVHVYGDSNSLRMRIQPYMLNTTGCPGGIIRPWNFRQTCRSEELDYTITYDPHEQHMYFTKSGYWPLYRDGGVASHLDAIPSTGRHVVIVHYYLHIVAAHLTAAHNRLVMLRGAIERLLDRNPGVMVVLRGPHPMAIDWVQNHSMGGDGQSVFYRKILHQVFRPIRDRVMFLDGWEMGTAVENERVHPKNSVADGMMRLVLALHCGRDLGGDDAST